MARVETIVVGGGISAGSPFTTNGIPFVSNNSPPALATTPLFFRATAPESIVITTSGADPAAGASVALRVLGGIAGYEAGTNNRSYGDGHTMATGTRSGMLVMGRANTVDCATVVVVGQSINTQSAGCVVFGQSHTLGSGWNFANIVFGSSIVFGTGSGGLSGTNVALGLSLTFGSAVVNDNTVVGSNQSFSGAQAKIVYIGGATGLNTFSSGLSDITAVGFNNGVSAANKSNVVMVGTQNTAAHNSCIVLGGGITTTADNQCLIGGPLFSGFIGSVIIGSGDTDTTQHNVTVRLTNGSGTDKAGNVLTIIPGLGTGAGTPGTIIFQTGATLGSGTTLQTAATRVTIAPTLVTFAVATLQQQDRGDTYSNQTSAAGAAAGTLNNAPAAGNPAFWLKIVINGTNHAIPCWLG